MFWNPKVETLPRTDMVTWQNHKLNKVIERVYEKSLLYSQRMEDRDLQPEKIKGVEDLVKLPFTTRQDLADNYPYGMLTMPVSGVAYIHSNQSSQALLTAMSYTNNDLIMWTELMSRLLVAGGVNRTSVFQVAMSGKSYAESFGLYNGARQLNATILPIIGKGGIEQGKVIQDFGVTGVFSTPEYMLKLSREMREKGKEPAELPLQTIFCNIQPWGEISCEKIRKEYQVQVVEIYGMDDVFGMGIGGECHCLNGLHLQEDCFYPEIIEPLSGETLPVGERGELVLTSLTLEAMPIIRYRTGIQGCLDDGGCPCGRTLIRFKKG